MKPVQVTLSLEDQERFADTLLNPPEPADALVRAFKRRKETRMTDRELLERAAKAAGLEYRWDDGCQEVCIPWEHHPQFRRSGDWRIWNPLNDNGDALWLAVKLEIRIDWGRFDVVAIEYDNDVVRSESKGDDSFVATRRAIVRVAAEIGTTKV